MKTKKIIKKTVGVSLGLAGAGIGMGIIGDALDSPGLSSAGSAAVGIVPVAVTVGMGGALINMLDEVRPKKKKGFRL